jgi:hypothetical protein
MPLSPRELSYQSFDDILAEVDRLHKNGYDRAGNWDLAQNLDHLRFFIEGGLEGYSFKVRWLIKFLLGKMVLRRILTQKKMKRGVFTPQKPLPPSGLDEAESVRKFKESLARFRSHQGEYQPSPFFGQLTRQECHEMNLIHCNHHLGYLIPKG